MKHFNLKRMLFMHTAFNNFNEKNILFMCCYFYIDINKNVNQTRFFFILYNSEFIFTKWFVISLYTN